MSIVRTRLVSVEKDALGMSELIDLMVCFHSLAEDP